MTLAQTMAQTKKLLATPITPGGNAKVGLAVKAAGVGKPLALFGGQKPGKIGGTPAPAKPVNPYDAFALGNEYDPTKINSLATSGYQTDVDQATKLSQMGYLTPAQIDAQSKNRADQETALGASLAAALNGIQQAYVSTGNGQGAALGTADAASAAAGARGQGAAGATPATTAVADAGAQAVLGSQTASGANVYGGAAAAALSAADQNARQAYLTGDTTKQTNLTDQQKQLASLLTSVPSISSRTSTMLDANEKNAAADKATDLTIWNSMEARRLTAQSENDKVGEAKAATDEKNFEATLGATTKKEIANAANTSRETVATTNAGAKVTTAKINAAAKKAAKTAGLTPSQNLQLVKLVQKTIGTQGGVKEPSTVTTGGTVTLGPVIDPKTKQPSLVDTSKVAPVKVSAEQLKTLKAGGTLPGYPGRTITAVAPTTKAGATTVKDAPSAWTKWKRALGAVQSQTGLSRTAAVQYMAGIGYPAPPSQ